MDSKKLKIRDACYSIIKLFSDEINIETYFKKVDPIDIFIPFDQGKTLRQKNGKVLIKFLFHNNRHSNLYFQYATKVMEIMKKVHEDYCFSFDLNGPFLYIMISSDCEENLCYKLESYVNDIFEDRFNTRLPYHAISYYNTRYYILNPFDL